MVPRVEVFSIENGTSIKEAAEELENQGYSRVPVFSETVDQITGVLMYKDLLSIYEEAIRTNRLELLDAPVETVQKPAIYTPETKKISSYSKNLESKKCTLPLS